MNDVSNAYILRHPLTCQLWLDIFLKVSLDDLQQAVLLFWSLIVLGTSDNQRFVTLEVFELNINSVYPFHVKHWN